MSYEIKFYKDAYKSLQKQDVKIRSRILDHINQKELIIIVVNIGSRVDIYKS